MSVSEAVATRGEPSTMTLYGWGSTPTSEPNPAQKVKPEFPLVFTRSWQRTLLYILLALLIILIFVNIGITLWIISAMKLTMNKVGPIKITRGGIELEGQAFVLDRLIASTIMSRTAQPITMHSYRNFSIHVSDPAWPGFSKLLIKRDALQFTGKSVIITDIKGKVIFNATSDEVMINADALNVQGPGGISVKSAVQATAIKAPPGCNLELESQTRRLDLRAPQLIHLESRAGSIDITSHADIKMDSVVGAIKIDAQNIYINKLREAKPQKSNATRPKNEKNMKFYQLCACASGKLFLAPSEGFCVSQEYDHELCR